MVNFVMFLTNYTVDVQIVQNLVVFLVGLVRFLNRNRNRGFFQKPRKTETAISPCIRDDFLPETLKFPTSAVSKYMKFNSL